MRLPKHIMGVVWELRNDGVDIPSDMKEDSAVELIMEIYGLLQAARKFFKKLAKKLSIKLGFVQSKTDPCLF